VSYPHAIAATNVLIDAALAWDDLPTSDRLLALHEAVTNYRAARARPQRQGGDRANESLDVQPVESEPPERNG